MKNFDRYGSVEIDEDNRITGFFEKSFKDVGLINCGVYILNPSILNNYQIEGKFSFEKEFMQKHPEKHNFYGKKGDGYFIDIGIPEDYHRAKEYFFG